MHRKFEPCEMKRRTSEYDKMFLNWLIIQVKSKQEINKYASGTK